MNIEILTAGEALKKYSWDELKGRPVIAPVAVFDYAIMGRGVITEKGEKGTDIAFCFKYHCEQTGELMEIGIFWNEQLTLFAHHLADVILPKDRAF